MSCKAELEGTMPEITLTISQVSEGEVTPLDHLLTHPCVQSADADIVDEGEARNNCHLSVSCKKGFRMGG